MTWITDERKIWKGQLQFNRNLPIRIVSKRRLLKRMEATMNGCDLIDTCLMKSFNCADPQLQIRIYRILNHHRNINALQSISDFLHCKRTDCGSCADPKNID